VFWSCFKTFFISTFNASKVSFIHFYLNGELHAVYIRKPSERMWNFWTVQFLKLNPNRISVFCTSLLNIRTRDNRSSAETEVRAATNDRCYLLRLINVVEDWQLTCTALKLLQLWLVCNGIVQRLCYFWQHT